jgi:hypothetical protein
MLTLSKSMIDTVHSGTAEYLRLRSFMVLELERDQAMLLFFFKIKSYLHEMLYFIQTLLSSQT